MTETIGNQCTGKVPNQYQKAFYYWQLINYNYQPCIIVVSRHILYRILSNFIYYERLLLVFIKCTYLLTYLLTLMQTGKPNIEVDFNHNLISWMAFEKIDYFIKALLVLYWILQSISDCTVMSSRCLRCYCRCKDNIREWWMCRADSEQYTHSLIAAQ